VDRLRVRIAADTDIGILTSILIYFVKKIDGETAFKQLKINQYGAIQPWPKGFFDQSQKEAEKIIAAAIQKKKAESVK
jgi:predicted ATPase